MVAAGGFTMVEHGGQLQFSTQLGSTLSFFLRTSTSSGYLHLQFNILAVIWACG